LITTDYNEAAENARTAGSVPQNSGSRSFHRSCCLENPDCHATKQEHGMLQWLRLGLPLGPGVFDPLPAFLLQGLKISYRFSELPFA
jgi:hypothetical protein